MSTTYRAICPHCKMVYYSKVESKQAEKCFNCGEVFTPESVAGEFNLNQDNNTITFKPYEMEQTKTRRY